MGSSTQNNTGYFNRIRSGLNKTSSIIRTGITGLFQGGGKRLDEEELEHLEQILIESDLGVELTVEIMDSLRERKQWASAEAVRDFLRNRLANEFLTIDRNLKSESRPRVILFAGINGSGKTTSIAKITHALHNQGQKVILAAADTFRAAAIDQLGIWADKLGAPLVRHQMGSDPAAVAHDACESAKARNIDTVLIDTAGRLHNQNFLMEELKKIVRVVNAKAGEAALECLLVLDGNAGQNSFVQAKNFQSEIGVDGIVITKLDGTAKGGIVVSVEKELGIPVKFIGVGEQMGDLVPFVPEAFVEALIDIQPATGKTS